MCMHAKFSRKFVEFEKSMKKLKNKKNIEHAVDMLQKSGKAEKTRLNKLSGDIKDFRQNVENTNSEMFFVVDNINSTITNLLAGMDILNIENTKMNQTITELTRKLTNMSQQMDLMEHRTNLNNLTKTKDKSNNLL